MQRNMGGAGDGEGRESRDGRDGQVHVVGGGSDGHESTPHFLA